MYRERKRRPVRRFFLIPILLGLAWLLLAVFRVGGVPEVEFDPELPGIGKQTPVRIAVEEAKRGTPAVRVEVEQGERVVELLNETFSVRAPWDLRRATTPRREWRIDVGSETVEGLKEGKATVRVTAARAGTWLRRPPATAFSVELPVRLRPPSLQIVSTQHYVAQGGCEVVVYRAGPTAQSSGVQAGEWWFPGYPLPGGGSGMRFALFGVPYDLEDSSAVHLVAQDDVGNRASASFVDRFTRQPLHTAEIGVSDQFLEKVVPEILAQTPEISDRGELLANYLVINNDLRSQNAETIVQLARGSQQDFLWRGRFRSMPNAQVMSAFADRRSYTYEGEVVDRQDHLGFDLASVQRAPVPAANSGRVVLARYFGIYGNAVVLDHGYGLMSLYGHLSSIAVEEGEEVSGGQELGRSGETGLAGGDHLHFTMLLNGLAVTPLEWWDDHWIRDRLRRKLAGALPPGE